MDDNLKMLADRFNQRYFFKYENSFIPKEVNINIIKYNKIGTTEYGYPIIDPIIRVSTLNDDVQSWESWNVCEIKWEGALHEWYQALTDDAKSHHKYIDKNGPI